VNIQKIRPFHKNRAVNLHFIMKNRQERQISFLVVWLTMFSCISAHAQNLLKKVNMAPDFKHLSLPGHTVQYPSYSTDINGLNLSWGMIVERSMNSGKIYVVPSNIYYTQSGIMCKMEWQVEKATHVPLRIRLGSLADCNALEGKH
jgi:hypothetical protein